MPDIRNNYPPYGDLTITLASLASDTNLLAGVQSSEIDNSATRYQDFLASGLITTGTSPTGGSIEVWAIAAFDATSATYPNVITNVAAARTWTNTAIKNGAAKLVYAVAPSTANNIGYPFSNVSIASLFGGVCPPRFVIFVTHSTGVILNATAANHFIRMQPFYTTIS